MHSFFVDPDVIRAGTASIDGDQAHQISQVLRLRPGEYIGLLDDSGWQYEVVVESTGRQVTGRVIGRSLVATEPRTKITLYQGLIRGPRFDLVLQKCTEIGVVAFVPTICDRSVVAHFATEKGGKQDRWHRIVTEAAEQSGRGKRPIIRPAMLFQQACEHVRGLALIPWEGEDALGLREVLREGIHATDRDYVESAPRSVGQRPFSVSLFIGPEGGFTPEEVATARGYGIVPVSLGPRILRAETAAIVASSIALAEFGDLDPAAQGER
jgi:16S rRNA (uracil1498-N3)-methyltransferase